MPHRFRQLSRHFCATCCPAGTAIRTSCSLSPERSSDTSTTRASACRPSPTGFTTTSSIASLPGRPDISAAQIIERGYGVCRDFAHCTIALCRAINIPARYVTGHLPDIGHVDPGSPMDFHAYSEVYLGDRWHVFDARYNEPRIGRIKIAQGLDAVECAFATVYGPAKMTKFEVWAYQVDPNSKSLLGDPIDLSKRLDGTEEIKS